LEPNVTKTGGSAVPAAEGASLDVRACLERVRRGDDDAARQLVEHLYPLVIKIVRSHLPWRMSEEDLAQDIYLKIFANMEQYRGEVPFEHWVSRVAVTTCLDKLRAQMRRPELRWADLNETEAEVLQAVTAAEDEAHPADGLAARELVEKLLQTLGPEDRLVLTLLDMEQKSVAEIRGITGWNLSAIKVRAFRARRKLRRQLAELDQDQARREKK
jgi:RNA polymerase sigma factor (sigma-70 family)